MDAIEDMGQLEDVNGFAVSLTYGSINVRIEDTIMHIMEVARSSKLLKTIAGFHYHAAEK